MKTIIIITLSVLIGCCGPQPEYYTQQGVGVYEHGLNLPYGWMDEHVQCYIDYLPWFLPEYTSRDIAESIDQVVVEWQPEPYYVPGIGMCAGTRHYYIVKAVWDPEDPDYSSAILYHELTHWFLADMTGDGDGRHLHEIWGMTDHIVGLCESQ